MIKYINTGSKGVQIHATNTRYAECKVIYNFHDNIESSLYTKIIQLVCQVRPREAVRCDSYYIASEAAWRTP